MADSTNRPRPQPIAVIGLSARYAGGVHTPEQLWQHLKAGIDPITDFPEGRWDRAYLNADPAAKGRSYIYAGGYLDDVAGFDAEFFGISPREAHQMDPQQRLLLELAWEAIEHAGVLPARLAGSATGVYVGLSSRDYGDYQGDDGIDAYTNLGLSMSIASNRISYILDLKGPSLTLDTACSSGMVALHQAVQALRRGECSAALCGAVNLIVSPKAFIGFSKASMLSPAGRCTPFDAGGAGYVRAEGGGMLLLKPLADAERDGDPILGLILATGVNSDGRTMGIAMPSATAQAALLRQVYDEAGLQPDDVAYVEAHGTGTAVGDPIECEAIASVLGGGRRAAPLPLGSIKSNVGHLEPAAGIAGLTKVLLSLKHRELPANLHFRTPNPKIDFAGWQLEVVDRHRPLQPPRPGRPLVCGVNSFGFGGTNGHAVLQAYEPPARPQAAPQPAPATPWQDMLVLSGHTPAALRAVAERWLPRLQAEAASAPPQAAERWEALRAAALHLRTPHAHRLALHAANAEEAAARVADFLAGTAGAELAVGRAPAGGRPPLAFVYAGNGPQWWAMGRELMAADATYRAAVEAVDAHFRPLAGWSIVDELTTRDEAGSRMALTEVAQPTLFALQVGLTTVLRAAGLQADAVIGHSVGEVAAAWASGALDLAQATRVIHQRSLAQAATAGMGRMAALGLPAGQAREAIARIGGFLELAAVNSPQAVTVAGEAALVERLVEETVAAGRFGRVLALDYPFHTRAMDGIRDGLARGLDGLAPAAGTLPFVSTVEGRVVDGRELGAGYWWRNVREPVVFEAGVGHLLEALKVGAFIEIGPHPVLRDYLLQCAKARGAQPPVLTTLRRPRGDAAEPELALLRQTVCAAYAQGLAEPQRLAAAPARRVELPAYPWQRSRYWRGEHALPDLRPPTRRDHPLLGWRPHGAVTAWQTRADLAVQPWLADHVIQGAPIFPGAGYVELALAAGAQLHGADAPLQVEHLDFLKPMVLGAAAPWVSCRVDAADGRFEIDSRADAEPGEATLHARGRVTLAEPGHRPPPVMPVPRALPLAADTHYAIARRRGMDYGAAFRVVGELSLSAPGEPKSVAAWIELPAAAGELAPYRSHPALLDGALQMLIPLLARDEGRECAYIPVHVARLRSDAPLPRRLFAEAVLERESERSGSARIVLRDEHGACVMLLEGARFQKMDFAAGREPMRVADHWRPDAAEPARPAPALDLPAPAAVLAALGPAAQLAPAPAAADDAFEALAGRYAVEALQALAGDAAADGFTVGSLQRRARIDAAQLPLYRTLVAWAQADGALVERDGRLAFAAAAAEPARRTAAAEWQALMLAHPAHAAELQLLAQAGEQLPALLRGEAEPARLRGSERPHPALLTLLDGAPFSAPAHTACATLLARLTAAWPAGRMLRLLQLEAGFGGLAAALQPLLPAARSDHALHDVDAALLARLAPRPGQASPLRTLALDLADEAALAAERGRYDLVVAEAGLATLPLPAGEVLARLRGLVAAGGWLMLLAPRPRRLATLLFGQDAAWWRDGETPLADGPAWAALAEAAGWQGALALPCGAQTLLLAQCPNDAGAADGDSPTPLAAAEPAPAPRRWLLLADAGATAGFAAALAAALQVRGQAVRTLNLADGTPAPGELAADDADGLAAALAAPLDGIVHLAGLAGLAGGSSDGATEGTGPLAVQALRCLPLIALAQTQQREDRATLARPRLAVVTRGATLGPDAAAAGIDPAQAPAWGLSRVLGNEHPDFAPRRIDLHLALDEAAAARLADELLRDSDETEVLLDGRGRWLARLEAPRPAEFTAIAAALPAAAPVAAGAAPAAVRLQAGSQGGLEALRLVPAAPRAPAAGEVRLAVRAAGLNFRDVLWAMHMLPEEAVEHGFSGATIGMECAGEVLAVGEGVAGLAVGDRVIGFASGCFASEVTTRADAVAPMPAGLSFAEAATLPTAFLTAHYALVHLARLEPGERVLIHGAAGGVGLAAVQIARRCGAVVFGTAGSVEKRRLLRLMGVDHVLDSRSLAFADDVLALTGGEGVDVVLNSLAGEAIARNLQLLRPFGRFCEIGKRDFYANSRIGLKPFSRNLSYFGIDADTLLVERPALARRLFAEVAQAVAAGELRPLPHQAVPIGRAAQAFRLMQQSRHVGKIVVTLPAAGAPPLRAEPEEWQARGDGTWLVSGGLGGFGLASARWLATRGVRALALVGRRGATTDEAREGLAALAEAGVTVRSFAADVGDEAALRAVLAEVRATMPPLRGVLHSAMVLDDAPLHLLDRERLQRVLAPKLAGAWLLDRLTREDPLEHFVLYSSATIVVGNPGQGNYVAANIYLQALAQQRRALGLPALSIAWGAIEDVGVVTRTEGLAQLLEKRSGIAATPSAEALQELGRMLAAQAVAVSVAPFNLQRLAEMLPSVRVPRFAALAPQGAQGGGRVRETLAERWPHTAAEARRPLLLEVLREHLARILGTAAAQVDVERPLAEMGLDSLMAVELASSLEREVGRPVSVMQMIQASSAAAVADTLLASLQPAAHG